MSDEHKIELTPDDLALAHRLHELAVKEAGNQAVLVDLLAAAWLKLTDVPADQAEIVSSGTAPFTYYIKRKEEKVKFGHVDNFGEAEIVVNPQMAELLSEVLAFLEGIEEPCMDGLAEKIRGALG